MLSDESRYSPATSRSLPAIHVSATPASPTFNVCVNVFPIGGVIESSTLSPGVASVILISVASPATVSMASIVRACALTGSAKSAATNNVCVYFFINHTILTLLRVLLNIHSVTGTW